MGMLIGLGLALLLAVSLFLANIGRAAPDAPTPKPAVERPESVQRAQLAAQLRELAATPAPKDLAPGAMCYKPAMPPDRFEYVCPTCGGKTLIANPKRSRTPWELDACRRLVKQIKGLDVRLVETGFCKACSPDGKGSSLDLVVRYDDKAVRTDGIAGSDLQLIAEFLAGKRKHAGAQGSERPLRDFSARLRQLLGLPK